MNILFGAEVKVSTSRLALSFPDQWIPLLAASPSLACTLWFEIVDSSGLTLLAAAGSLEKFEQSILFIALNSSITKD